MSKANRLQSPWIPAFSGLRFLIIIFLCLHHFDAFNDLQVPGWSEVMRLLTEGYLSVNFFFILSGFVIQYSYGPQLRQGVLSTKSFLFNRFAHLWPTYLLALAAALVVYAGVSAPYYLKTSSFWCHVFMVQSWIPDSTFAFNFNGAAWSVSTEVFFYLLFPCLVQLKDKHRNALMVGLWGGILLNILVMGLASPLAGWLLYINPVFRLAEFLLGIWLCDLFRTGLFAPSSKKSATIMEGVAVLILVCSIGIAMSVAIGWQWRWQIFYTIPTAILIYVFSFSRGYLSALLGCRFARFLGELAFPIYLIHQILINLAKRLFLPQLVDSQALLLAGIGAIVVSILLAIPIQFLFAKPLNRWLRRQWERHMQRSAL